ncbi:uncharacterized protein EI90DRAFT_3115822 [Cantharellus anzutake]|uniref:uncharacterized protein n=1 Tax=Cantharellus anzutake TaxID=1750568 RepID=UPI00190720E1|nr:uncharacterized protein EI90DRAFT_3115822 [Cantharellus anzutake]KAF8341984.1 hypothetical protein EI90DRAFT_3115822 [Cantharellus anzutake]
MEKHTHPRFLPCQQLRHRQWRWDNFILPFLNTVNRFKFLVDLKWIDQKVGVAGVIDDAPGDVHDLHTHYFELKFKGGRNPSMDDFDKRYGYVQRTPEILNEAGMKYILLSLWRHHPSNEARAHRAANMTAFKFSKLHVGDYPMPPPPPSQSGHFMPEPAPPVPLQKMWVSLSQLMDGNYGHLPAAMHPPTPLPIPNEDKDMKSDGKATTWSVDETAPLPERRFPAAIRSETEDTGAGPSDLSCAAVSAATAPSSKKGKAKKV